MESTRPDKHLAISMLKDLARELGRTPTRSDARDKGIDWHLSKIFGSFSAAIEASGLGPVTKRGKSKDILLRDISSHLKGHESKKLRLEERETILAIGDTHFPFCDLEALSLVYRIAEEVKPKHIIQMGDLYDFFSHSKFPRSSLTFNPKEEMDLGREQAEKMWWTLQDICPGAKCYQILGNHSMRPIKRLIESYPEGEIFFEFHKWLQFDNVQLNPDVRQPTIIQGIYFQHGYSSRLGFHRDHNHANTVCGHTHRGGVAYRNIEGRTLWELNCGYLGDEKSKALGYTPTRVSQWTKGVGVIDQMGPRFVSFADA